MKTFFALLSSLALLAGCFGLPEGSADVGDQVALRLTATDLETGQVLVENEGVTVLLGAGTSGFGSDLERALRGRLPDDTFTLESRDDAGRSFRETVRVNRILEPFPIQNEVPLETYENVFGEAAVGDLFPLSFYQGRVDAVEDGALLYSIIAQDGQRNAVPQVGAFLVSHVTESEILRELEPQAGARFAVSPPTPFNPSTPLGLAPGSYEVVGAVEDEIILRYAPGGRPELVGRDVRFEVTVVSIVPAGEAQEPVEGNFAVRRSPQLLGAPSFDEAAATAETDEHGH